MPCGPALINAVAGVLTAKPKEIGKIQRELPAFYTRRAIRYAITALIQSGKAKRKGQQGPVYAVEESGAYAHIIHRK